MSEQLPERIDPKRLAQKDTRLAGVIPIEKMSRLRPCRAAGVSDVRAELTFSESSADHVLIEGWAATRVELICQRCLEPMQWPLEAAFGLALVQSDEEAARLDAAVEPLLWEDGTGSLTELVEDELILALPVVARHSRPDDCGPAGRITASGDVPEEEPDNPFRILEQLKSGRQDG